MAAPAAAAAAAAATGSPSALDSSGPTLSATLQPGLPSSQGSFTVAEISSYPSRLSAGSVSSRWTISAVRTAAGGSAEHLFLSKPPASGAAATKTQGWFDAGRIMWVSRVMDYGVDSLALARAVRYIAVRISPTVTKEKATTGIKQLCFSSTHKSVACLVLRVGSFLYDSKRTSAFLTTLKDSKNRNLCQYPLHSD